MVVTMLLSTRMISYYQKRSYFLKTFFFLIHIYAVKKIPVNFGRMPDNKITCKILVKKYLNLWLKRRFHLNLSLFPYFQQWSYYSNLLPTYPQIITFSFFANHISKLKIMLWSKFLNVKMYLRHTNQAFSRSQASS